jgi:hypothetical protein
MMVVAAAPTIVNFLKGLLNPILKIVSVSDPTINPRLEDIAIFPKFLLLFSSDDISAR